MKRNTLFLSCLIAFFALALGGCKAHIATFSAGKPDTAHLLLLRGYGSHLKKATIQLDDQEPVELKKIRKETKVYKARPYPITPGKHHLKVSLKNKTFLDEHIYIGVQETKKIVIPHKSMQP